MDMGRTADSSDAWASTCSLGERDLNLYNRFVGNVRTPVIRPCTPAENLGPGIDVPRQHTFLTDQGRSSITPCC